MQAARVVIEIVSSNVSSLEFRLFTLIYSNTSQSQLPCNTVSSQKKLSLYTEMVDAEMNLKAVLSQRSF